MTDEKPKKKPVKTTKDKGNSPTQFTQQSPSLRVGEMLRRTREEKKLSVEEVASAINIRVAQLRAIEEGDLEALPGMIYATGFVRSYANFLKLDGTDISKQFKEEHGSAGEARPELHFPEPIAESKMPNTGVIIGAAAGAVILLVLWGVFSGSSSDEEKIAGYIQPAPGSEVVADQPAPAAAAPGTDAPAIAAAVPESQTPAAAMPNAPASETTVAAMAASAGAVAGQAPAAASLTADQQSQVVPTALSPDVIEVKPQGHVVIVATSPVWVQVSDKDDQVIFKKVLQAGEKYFVPDQKDLSLVTSNAGGLDVFVDDKKVQAVGKPGEILRGVSLSPSALSQKRIQIRN